MQKALEHLYIGISALAKVLIGQKDEEPGFQPILFAASVPMNRALLYLFSADIDNPTFLSKWAAPAEREVYQIANELSTSSSESLLRTVETVNYW